MRLNTFENADEINRRLAKASEQHLPADERRGAFVPGEDPTELRPVRRMSFTERSHVEIGIKGGQGRSGAKLEQDATPLAIAIAAAALCLIAAFFLR